MSPKNQADQVKGPEKIEQPVQIKYVKESAPSGGSGMGVGQAILLLAALFIFGPVVFKTMVYRELDLLAMLVVILFGVVLFIVGGGLSIYTRYYHRAPADKAFVRTGAGGSKVIVNGGALVIPGFHQVIWVSLRTLKLEVTRSGPDALITKDYLRCNITAEFFIRVPADPERVQVAATSLGIAADDPEGIQSVLEKKLESALRQVAAEMALDDLLVNRVTFIEKVSKHIKDDIAINGIQLETVTISQLDQTPTDALNPEKNIFDAQGAKKITQITTEQNVERNRLTLEANRKIKEETVKTNTFLYEQDIAQASAEANKAREIKVATASAEQDATTKAAELQRQAKLAEVARDQAIQLAQVTQAQAVDIAQQDREKAVQTATIAKEQTIQVAKRQQDIAVAEKEKSLAEARAKQLEAEVEKARRAQQVTTVEITAAAEREKAKSVIAAQAEAQRNQVKENTQADIAAYSQVKQAEAAQLSAQKQAEALLTQAQAQMEANKRQAEGAQVLQMVPVEVAKKQVEVEQAKVAVARQDLSNKAEFESIARELQVELAKIEADKQVRIESAKAFGVALSTAHIQMWGDPTMVQKMAEAFMSGQRTSTLIQGFAQNTPQLEQLTPLLMALAKKFGIELTPEQVQSLTSDVISGNGKS